MKNQESLKKYGPIAAVVLALILAVGAFLFFKNKGPVLDEVEIRSLRPKKDGPCPGETVTLTMDDVYMAGMIEQGEKFKAVMNYYSCNPLKRGDAILMHLSASMDPVVKIVRGLPGDRFELKKDGQGQGWNVVINGDVIQWEEGKRPYFFGGKQPPTLALYEKNRKGVLGPDEIIILGTRPPGNNDSGLFGVFSVNDILGKVSIESVQKKSEAEPPKPQPAKVQTKASEPPPAAKASSKTKEKPQPAPKKKAGKPSP